MRTARGEQLIFMIAFFQPHNLWAPIAMMRKNMSPNFVWINVPCNANDMGYRVHKCDVITRARDVTHHYTKTVIENETNTRCLTRTWDRATACGREHDYRNVLSNIANMIFRMENKQIENQSLCQTKFDASCASTLRAVLRQWFLESDRLGVYIINSRWMWGHKLEFHVIAKSGGPSEHWWRLPATTDRDTTFNSRNEWVSFNLIFTRSICSMSRTIIGF